MLIAILLAIVMRSLVAPLYLVTSVLLSYLAALGLTALIFVHFGGQSGINFVLPFLMFVFLMALGSDYNVLVMTRIREESHHLQHARRGAQGDRRHRHDGDDRRAHPRRHVRGARLRRAAARREDRRFSRSATASPSGW